MLMDTVKRICSLEALYEEEIKRIQGDLLSNEYPKNICKAILGPEGYRRNSTLRVGNVNSRVIYRTIRIFSVY